MIEDCNEALQIDSNWKKALHRKGQALRAMDISRAQSAYRSLLEIDPKSTTALKGMKQLDALERKFTSAEKLLERGKYREAYDKAVEIMKKCADAPRMHKVKLKYMSEMKMYDEVTKYSTYLLRKKIDDNEILLIRAKAFYWNSNFSLCMKHLQQVLRRDPDYRPAQKQLKQLRKLEKTKKMKCLKAKNQTVRGFRNMFNQSLKSPLASKITLITPWDDAITQIKTRTQVHRVFGY